jgi:hypothetical protein
LGDDRIAYQVFGEGDIDLLYASVTGDAIDLQLRDQWLVPRLGSFGRSDGRHLAHVMMTCGSGHRARTAARGWLWRCATVS